MLRSFPAALLCAVLLLVVGSPAQDSPAASAAPQAAPNSEAAAPSQARAPGAQAAPAPQSLAPALHATTWQVRTEPATLVNGAPAVLYVAPPVKLQALGGSWMGHKIFFSFDSGSGSWYALFGVNLNAPPGKYRLSLEGRPDTGAAVSFEQELEVASQPYPTVELKVQHRFTAPSRRLLKRIKKEEILKHHVFGESSDSQLWSGSFVAPVREPVTEDFGVRRVFNGELKREHQGLDYHAPRGTRVVAANSGTVLLARRLFFEGNCVIVDHGEGLMTLYMHLSKFKVRRGQRVRRGQLLGLSGATGRATGPHLHLAVRWEGVYLDPSKLLKLDLPPEEAVHAAAAGATPHAGQSGDIQNRAWSQN